MNETSYILPSLLDQGALSLAKGGYPSFIVFTVGGLAYHFMTENVTGTDGVGIGNTKWNIISTVLGCLIGALLWKEEITMTRWTGVAMSLGGLYLIG